MKFKLHFHAVFLICSNLIEYRKAKEYQFIDVKHILIEIQIVQSQHQIWMRFYRQAFKLFSREMSIWNLHVCFFHKSKCSSVPVDLYSTLAKHSTCISSCEKPQSANSFLFSSWKRRYRSKREKGEQVSWETGQNIATKHIQNTKYALHSIPWAFSYWQRELRLLFVKSVRPDQCGYKSNSAKTNNHIHAVTTRKLFSLKINSVQNDNKCKGKRHINEEKKIEMRTKTKDDKTMDKAI